MSLLSEANFGQVICDLGNGLVIRHASPSDAQALLEFNRIQQSDDGIILADGVGSAVWDHISGRHPTVDARYYTVVEDTQSRQIVSTLCYVPHTWSYAGLEIPVGQIEFVSTAPEYRRKGLIRAQMDVVHKWSAEQGDLLQFITGIPWYYRQFGYEYALEYRRRSRGYFDQIPALKAEQTEPYHFQAATEDDLPFIQQALQQAYRRYLVHSVIDADYLRYDLLEKHVQSFVNEEKIIIYNEQHEKCGVLFVARIAWNGFLMTSQFEVVAGYSWLAIIPSALRYIRRHSSSIPSGDQKPIIGYSFVADADHPVHQVAEPYFAQPPTHWDAYVRMPDIRKFVQRIIPVLESRLQNSVACGHSSTLAVHWYTDGMRIGIEHGKIVTLEPYQPEKPEFGDAGFGNLTILKLLMGHSSLDELKAMDNDVFAYTNETRVLLNILFPKQSSFVWGNL